MENDSVRHLTLLAANHPNSPVITTSSVFFFFSKEKKRENERIFLLVFLDFNFFLSQFNSRHLSRCSSIIIFIYYFTKTSTMVKIFNISFKLPKVFARSSSAMVGTVSFVCKFFACSVQMNQVLRHSLSSTHSSCVDC